MDIPSSQPYSYGIVTQQFPAHFGFNDVKMGVEKQGGCKGVIQSPRMAAHEIKDDSQVVPPFGLSYVRSRASYFIMLLPNKTARGVPSGRGCLLSPGRDPQQRLSGGEFEGWGKAKQNNCSHKTVLMP
ncbi:MAG: hypothetical protein DPW16_12285 [Chloroflexi bacterium]|nr:hypothetical protein [Chloroflexota bacterium]